MAGPVRQVAHRGATGPAGWDGMGWDGMGMGSMGWETMGLEGLESDRKGVDGVRSDQTVSSQLRCRGVTARDGINSPDGSWDN